MSRALRRDWRWLMEWTWASPQVPVLSGQAARQARRNGDNENYYRPRLHDYALMPEAALIGECLRRGFLENA